MWKLSAKWVPKCLKADQARQRCQSSEEHLEFFRCDPNNFLSGAIGDHGRNLVISLWPGDKATINGVAALQLAPTQPKSFRVQKSVGNVFASIFWDQDGILALTIFRRAKLSTRSITHLCWSNWRTFWRKNAAVSSRSVFFLHDNVPANRALATQNKLAYQGFHCVDHPPYSSDLAPSEYHLFPWLKKTIEKLPFFFRRGSHCCRGDLVERTIFWIFFEWLAKVRTTG